MQPLRSGKATAEAEEELTEKHQRMLKDASRAVCCGDCPTSLGRDAPDILVWAVCGPVLGD